MNKSTQKQISVLENLITKLKRTTKSVDVTGQSKAMVADLKGVFDKVIIHYERDVNKKYTGRTFCVLKEDNKCYLGVSSQSFSDETFNKQRGRLIAAGRAYYSFNSSIATGAYFHARESQFMFSYTFGDPTSELRSMGVPTYLYKMVPKSSKKIKGSDKRLELNLPEDYDASAEIKLNEA